MDSHVAYKVSYYSRIPVVGAVHGNRLVSSCLMRYWEIGCPCRVPGSNRRFVRGADFPLGAAATSPCPAASHPFASGWEGLFPPVLAEAPSPALVAHGEPVGTNRFAEPGRDRGLRRAVRASAWRELK